jgi:phytoene dehydrogenase-like protein
MDVYRHPLHAPATALQPVGKLRDKLLVGKLRCRVRRLSLETIAAGKDMSTADFLRQYGFSERMIDEFFRPFYGGIFLERDLRTSSRMFEFTFKMFAEGFATIPAAGMEDIPRQLADRLPRQSIRTNTPVASVERGAVTLENGERWSADAVVVATDAQAAGRLIPGFTNGELRWRSVTGLYFSASKSPLEEAIIALNGSADGLVSSVCVLSDVAPGYAPEGKALISVSVLGLPEDPNLEENIREELKAWFGAEVDGWRHLRTYRIRRALPEQLPSADAGDRAGFEIHEGIHVCGDHCASASIEGALVSGKRTAEAILREASRAPA